MECPLLLLDIDGALSPIVSAAEHLLFVADIEGVDPALPSWLDRLSSRFQLVWATMWEEDANRVFGPALGLPPLPYISFDRGGTAETYKLQAVTEFVGQRPFAWVDDDLGQDVTDFVSRHPAPALLVRTSPRTGITSHDISALVSFAAELA